jgi:hypothetical protein
LESPEIKLGKIRKSKSLLHPQGLWFCEVKSFQYDMSLDASIPYKNIRQEFLKIALKHYNESDQAKSEYLKWQLKIQ